MEALDFALDDVPIGNARGVLMRWEARDEGLKAFKALLVKALELDQRLCVIVDAKIAG